MDLLAGPGARYIRVVSIISLLLGLNDAARLLGVSNGGANPIAQLGVVGFTWLAIFSLALLFASVGLWIKASWGAVLLVGAVGTELFMYVTQTGGVQMTQFGFAVRLVLLIALSAIFLLGLRIRRERAHD